MGAAAACAVMIVGVNALATLGFMALSAVVDKRTQVWKRN